MAIVLKDRVKETSATTGQGTLTLLGAVDSYQGFSAIGNGNTTYYAIVFPEDGSWEVGIGTYTSSGSTLSRDTVISNSLGTTAKINFGVGTKDVFCTYPAEKAIYEEATGNVLIDGGPITVVGNGVTGYTTFSAALGELYANVDSFAQLYAQNLNDGSSASADFVAYNDLGDGLTNFVDVGINSSNYSSVDYPIFTAGSAYLFNDGGELFVGSATDDLVLFAGGVDTTDETARFNKTTKALTTVGDVNVGAALDVTGAATFGSTVLLDADPTLALQAATKQYVDNATSNGFHVHTPVLVATTGNLTATYNNGTAGVGATLTNSGAQAAISVDGVSLSVNDRVLVWQQTTGLQNGVYVVTTVGSGSTNWVLTRSSDTDTSSEGDPNSLGGGDYFFVQSGTTLGYHSFVCTNTATITFGTTAITFSEFSSVPQYTGTSPINVSGSVISLSGAVPATNGGTGTTTVATGDLLYGSATNTWGKLAAGSAYKSLVMNAGGTNVEWNAVALNQSGAVSGSLGATNGGTGQNAYATGDMLYSDNTNSLAKLSGNTATTKKFLTQTGTGSASQAPAWGTISGSDVTSAVTSATNVAGGAANKIVYQTAADTTGFIDAPVTSGNALTWNGSSFAWAAAGATITDNTSTNTDYYPVWANSSSGSLTTAYVSSTKLTYNPGLGLLKLTSTDQTGTLVITDTGTSGANIKLTGNGATTPNKYVRSFNGNLEVVNSAYTTAIFTLSDAGAVSATSFSGSGTSLTSLDAGNLSTGTVGTARLGSGTASSSTYLRGDGTWSTVSASPAGSTTQVQYNNAGAFAGSANLTFNGTNLTCGGTVTANSDETLKTNWRNLPADFVEQLAKVKHGTYDRVDLKLTQDGVSAQSLQNLLPNSVLKGEDGKLSVAYGNAALVAAIALAERVVQLEAIVAKLTKGTDQ